MKMPTSRSLILAIPFLAATGIGCAAQIDADQPIEETSSTEQAASKGFLDNRAERIPESSTGLVRGINVEKRWFPAMHVVHTVDVTVKLAQNAGREIFLTLRSPSGAAYALGLAGIKGVAEYKVGRFAGEDPAGKWTLEAVDENVNGRRAILVKWELLIRTKNPGCFTDAECEAEEHCQGAVSCPEGAYCILPARPGTCVPDNCTTHADCQAGEHCAPKKASCPPGAYCILSVLPSTCEPIPAGRCLTHAECKPEEDCFGTMNRTYLGDCVPMGVECQDSQDCTSAETCDRHMHSTPPPGYYPILPQSGTCQPTPCQADADCTHAGSDWSCQGMTDDHPVGQCEPPSDGPDHDKSTSLNDADDNDEWLSAVERRLG